MRWLKVVLILPVGGSTKNGLSVVSFMIFTKNTHFEEVLETCILYLNNIGCHD
jgi:hypothetical protein